MAKQADEKGLVMAEEWQTFGEKLLNQVDPNGAFLNAEQRAAVLRIENSEDLKVMLYADLSDAHPLNIETAERVFGSLMRSFRLPQVLLTWRMFLLIQCQNCIDDMTKLMADKTLSGEERVNAGKARRDAIKDMDILIERATKLAEVVGGLKVPKVKPMVEKRPKNAPPSLDG